MNERSWALWAAVGAFALFAGCTNSDGDLENEGVYTGGGGDGGGEDGYYLGFVTTCGDEDYGAVVGIQVCSEESGSRVESGNSDSSGEYCSFSQFTEDASLRVEWWDPSSDTCIMAVTGLSVGRNPEWFDMDGCPDEASNHVGSCTSWDGTSGCWGS